MLRKHIPNQWHKLGRNLHHRQIPMPYQPPTIAFFRCGVNEARVPFERYGDRAAIVELDAQSVVGDRDANGRRATAQRIRYACEVSSWSPQ
jgi:hypothetical protein